MKVLRLLRTTALNGAMLAAAVASVPRSADAAPADYDYGYGAPGYAPTFGYDAAYYIRPPGYGAFRQFGGWYGQPYGYGGYYVVYGGYYGYGAHRRWSRR